MFSQYRVVGYKKADPNLAYRYFEDSYDDFADARVAMVMATQLNPDCVIYIEKRRVSDWESMGMEDYVVQDAIRAVKDA